MSAAGLRFVLRDTSEPSPDIDTAESKQVGLVLLFDLGQFCVWSCFWLFWGAVLSVLGLFWGLSVAIFWGGSGLF